MRTVSAAEIRDAVARLCVEANRKLPCDMECALRSARESEPWPLAKETLGTLCENLEAAARTGLPICQDTGMACVFAEIGQDVHIEGDFEAAVNEGVAKGYTEGLLRKSVVRDPIRRGNTGDNTPAVLNVRLVPGDKVRIVVAPKGFGSENMSRIAMLKPSQGEDRHVRARGTAREAGPAAPGRKPSPRPVLCGDGRGASRAHQCPRHGAAGVWRADDRPRRAD